MQISAQTRWKDIDWIKAEIYVKRLQLRIVKAVQLNKWRLVKRLQYLVTHSFYAKALAVRKVLSNKGKNTAGTDGVIWKSEKDKIEAILSLNPLSYSPKPVKRVYIVKFGKKEKRPLGIPCMDDRAMQALYLFALEPVAECLADTTSYGFRRYKSTKDAGEKIFKVLCQKVSSQWILEGDIKGCFDNISHEWLINNIPMDKTMLVKFLKSGFIDKKKLFPTLSGTAQGGIISPTLANLALDGIEIMIKTKFWSNQRGVIAGRHNKHKIHFIRYADDFVVTAESPDLLEEIKEMINNFLKERGLSLSDEKTLITNISNGFDFLGWNFRKYRNGKLVIQPSKNSIKKVVQALKQTVKRNYASSQERLIDSLNPILRGWANYHSSMCSSASFGYINTILWKQLKHWANRRHPHKSATWVRNRYWIKWRERYVFSVNNSILYPIQSSPIVRHTPPKESANSFLDEGYFLSRKNKLHKAYRRAFSKSTAGQLLKLSY